MNLRQLLDDLCEDEDIPLEELLEMEVRFFDGTDNGLNLLSITVSSSEPKQLYIDVGDES